MKIGLVGAMKCELSGIEEYLENRECKTVNRFEFVSGRIASCEIISVYCGIGFVNTALATQILINHFSVDCVINPGVAGGLSEELAISDVVVSKDCTYWDFNPKQLRANFPFLHDDYFPADAFLHEKCLSECKDAIAPNKLILGRVVSGQQFVSDKETKRNLRENLNADCVEMEGAAIAHTCYLTDTPYILIRSISDTIRDNEEQSSIAFNEFLPVACFQLTKVLYRLICTL